jgi:hypothetical protein
MVGTLRFAHPTPTALIIQPPVQFLERNHHMLGKRPVLLQRAVPALHLWQRRTLNLELEVTIQRGADWYIGERQRVVLSFSAGMLRHPIYR